MYTTHVCLKEVQHEALKLAAEQHDRTVSAEVRSAVELYLTALLRRKDEKAKREAARADRVPS
jgi:hypothetical protein